MSIMQINCIFSRCELQWRIQQTFKFLSFHAICHKKVWNEMQVCFRGQKRNIVHNRSRYREKAKNPAAKQNNWRSFHILDHPDSPTPPPPPPPPPPNHPSPSPAPSPPPLNVLWTLQPVAASTFSKPGAGYVGDGNKRWGWGKVRFLFSWSLSICLLQIGQSVYFRTTALHAARQRTHGYNTNILLKLWSFSVYPSPRCLIYRLYSVNVPAVRPWLLIVC